MEAANGFHQIVQLMVLNVLELQVVKVQMLKEDARQEQTENVFKQYQPEELQIQFVRNLLHVLMLTI